MKKQTIILSLLVILLASITASVFSQSLTQTIRGRILDEDSKSPLIGANVIIVNSNPLKGGVTDVDGNYRIDNVALGRVDIQIKYLGYEDKTMPNILVGSGKEVIMDFELKESIIKMDEVVVLGKKSKGEVQNEMAIVSSRSFSVEESKRYAGAIQDPSRMVSAFAGVTSDPSGNNDIVVRGNSPKGILWRMEGIEIPNPNHFANEGATGGPISALNSELLANSDFYTGAFAPEYGDAFSGVFDMKMRTGNNEKYEYSLGAGVNGVDATVEGPFKKGYGGSFLFNYRYSSLQMLNDAGVVDFDGVPKYQDAAFKVVLPSKKIGTLSVFAIGGLSNIYQEEEVEETGEIVEKVDFGANMGVIGISHTLPLTQNSFLRLNLSASGSGSDYKSDEIDDNKNFSFDGEGYWNKSSLRSGLMFSSKLNTRHRITTGIKFTRNFYDMKEESMDDELNRRETNIDMHENADDIQSYLTWKYRMSDDITWVGGLHTMYFSLNEKTLVEPRLAVRWQVNPRHSFNLGYGQHSKTESIIAYYTNVYNNDGSFTTPNSNLGLAQAHHYVLGYEFKISKNLTSKLDFYYQDLYNLPVENVDTSYFGMLNTDEGFIDKALVNSGTGKNYGVEYTLEKYFSQNYYFLITASLYDSKYKAKEGKERNTKYNGNYALNVLVGKEFKVRQNNTLGFNLKVFFNGGRRYIPVDLEASKKKGETVYDYSKAFDKKLDDLTQINFSTSYRINRPKASHEIIFEVLNATNNQARNWEYYDEYTGKIDYYRQLSLLPNIMYRIHF